jgi:hypothetical protein
MIRMVVIVYLVVGPPVLVLWAVALIRGARRR